MNGFSPRVDRAMEALRILDHRNRQAGADLRIEAYDIARDVPSLLEQLQEGDNLALTLDGSARLRRRRRLGILRYVEGWLRALPFFDPPVFPVKPAPEWRVFPLWDELELTVLYGLRESGRWRPAKDELNFDEARAFLEMRAGTLYRLTSKNLIPGIIRRHLGEGSGSHTGELRFSTSELVSWPKILRARKK